MARFEIMDPAASGLATDGAVADIYFELGLKYCSGRDVEADLIAAHKWFNLAALNGNRDAANHRQELSLEMSKAEVAEAQREAREWIRLH